jgi:hypothetical protein
MKILSKIIARLILIVFINFWTDPFIYFFQFHVIKAFIKFTYLKIFFNCLLFTFLILGLILILPEIVLFLLITMKNLYY